MRRRPWSCRSGPWRPGPRGAVGLITGGTILFRPSLRRIKLKQLTDSEKRKRHWGKRKRNLRAFTPAHQASEGGGGTTSPAGSQTVAADDQCLAAAESTLQRSRRATCKPGTSRQSSRTARAFATLTGAAAGCFASLAPSTSRGETSASTVRARGFWRTVRLPLSKPAVESLSATRASTSRCERSSAPTSPETSSCRARGSPCLRTTTSGRA